MKKRWMVTVFLIMTAMACTERDSVTGSYGAESLKVEIVMGGELASVSPAGIEVAVAGTGQTVISNDQGRLVLSGLPAGEVTLELHRKDGIDEVVTVDGAAGQTMIPLVTRRGRGRAVSRPARAIEGEVLEATDELLRIDSVKDGEVEVLLEDSTLIVKGAVTLIGSEIEPGEMVRVRVRTSDQGLVAELVRVAPRHAGDDTHLPASVVGEVLSNEDGTLTVLAQSGEETTVFTDERTEVYYKNQYEEVEEIEPGDRIKVFGYANDEGIVASWIRIKPDGGDDDDGLAKSIDGEVAAVGDDFIDLMTENGLVKVLIGPDTELKRRGRAISLDQIQAGDQVTAIGNRPDESTLEARKVIVHADDDDQGASIEGTVTAVSDSSITVDSEGTVYTVLVAHGTEIKRKGKRIGLSEVEVGSRVNVKGEWIDETTIDADRIIVK